MLENLFAVSLTTSFPILILCIFSPLLGKRYFSKLKYWIWLVIAVRLLIPYQFEISKTVVKLPGIPPYQINISENTHNAQENTQETVSENDYGRQQKEISSEAEAKQKSVSLKSILTLIWSLGATAFFLFHISSYLIFKKRILRMCRPAEPYNKLPVYTCENIETPMLIGFFKPKILLPCQNFSALELQIILKHEYVHYRRKDLWYKLLLTMSSAVHWFNPCIYLMLKFSNRDLEYSCDDEVIKNENIEFKKAYSMTILKTMKRDGGNKNE